jgi:hypothetical protein
MMRSVCIVALLSVGVSSAVGEPPSEQPPKPPTDQGSPAKPAVEIQVLPSSDVQAKLGDDANVRQIGFVPGYALRYLVPFKWKPEDPSHPMRLVQMRISAGANAALGDGVLAITGGIGGSVDDNVARWVAQFAELEGVATQQDLQIVGTPLLVTQVIATGTFDAASPGAAAELKPNMTLYGAIVQGVPEGTLFIKAVGPKETMAERRLAWDVFIRNLRIMERPKQIGPEESRGPTPPVKPPEPKKP